MTAFDLICYIIAAVLFGLAAINVPARVNLLAWVLVPLAHAVQAMH